MTRPDMLISNDVGMYVFCIWLRHLLCYLQWTKCLDKTLVTVSREDKMVAIWGQGGQNTGLSKIHNILSFVSIGKIILH